MTNEELNTLKELAEKWAESKQKHAEPCPSCGHCPTCGRGGHQLAPWIQPTPYYQPYPWWQQTWCGTQTIGYVSPVTTSGITTGQNQIQGTVTYTVSGN